MSEGRTLAEVFVAVRPDTSNTGREIERDLNRDLARVDTRKAGDSAGRKFGAAFGGAAKGLITGSLKALVGGGALALVGGKLAKDAADRVVAAGSDLNETVSKTQQIFGKSSAAVLKFGATADTALGTSNNAALTAAANYGNLFNNLGLTQKASAKMSTQLVKTASDLASFNNASPQEMLEGISSALAGEYDPLQRYGLAINAAAVKQEALRSGLAKTEKQITPAVQAQAAYNLILRQTGKATGDFARTQAGLANQQRIAGAQSENLKATLGESLLPAYLSVYQVVNKDLLPTLTQLAEKEGPRIAKTFGEIAEKRGPQLVGALKQGALGLSALAAAYREGDVTSDGFIGKAERIGVVLRDGKLAVEAYLAAYREGDVTSDGFIGKAERLGVVTRTAMDYLRGTAIPAVKDFFGSLRAGDTGELQTSLASAADSGERLLPVVQSFIEQMPSFADLVTVGAAGLEFLADNADTLQKYMPLLVAGLVAYKVAQAAANLAQVLAVPTKVAEVVVNRQLVKSNRELIASRAGVTAATLVGTAAEGGKTAATAAGTAATNAGVLASIRARVAQLAQATASVVVRGATVAWTAAQWLLNAALTANPIGLVVAGVALLVAGIIIAYQKSETFRTIVGKLWTGLKDGALSAVSFVLGKLDSFLGGIGTVLGAMAKLPGPLGAPFRAAAAAVQGARDKVTALQTNINNLKGKDVNVGVNIKAVDKTYFQDFRSPGPRGSAGSRAYGGWIRRAYGGPITGHGWVPGHSPSDRSDNIPTLMTGGEFVVQRPTARKLERQAPGFLQALNAGKLDVGGDAGALRYSAGTLRRAGGGSIPAVQSWLRAQDPKPYVWGASGPSAFDCSGIASAVYGMLTGKGGGSGQRYFTTDSIGAAQGFRPGLGTFSIGVTPGRGHMAGQLGGLKFEARSTAAGIIIGPGAASPASFARQFYLPQIGSVFGGGEPLTGEQLRKVVRLYGPKIVESVAGDLGFRRYDNGGPLPPGRTLVENGTGRTENVQTAAQRDEIAAAIAELGAEIRALRAELRGHPEATGRAVGNVIVKTGGAGRR